MAQSRPNPATRAEVDEPDRRIRYGGPWFSAASSLPLEGQLIRRGRLVLLCVAAVRRPGRFAALIVLLLRTRTEPLSLSDSPAGRLLRAYFDERSLAVFPRNRLCRGVLLLPPDHSEYLRGRRRQALRTNLRRAAAAGMTCETVRDRSAVLDQVLPQVYRSAGDVDHWRALLGRPEVTIMLTRQEWGRPLAIAGVVIDETVGLIVFAAATSHEARWALHDYLVQELIARRVRYLLAEGRGPFGALGFEANVHHYQRLLGYELRHLAPASSDPGTRWRRLASLLLTTVTAAALLATDAAAATPVRRSAGSPTAAPARLAAPCRRGLATDSEVPAAGGE